MSKFDRIDSSSEEPLSACCFGQALLHMEEALRILDEAVAPSDIGAHLDLAMCRLRQIAGTQGS